MKPHVFPFKQPLPAPSAPSARASQEPPLLIRLVPSHIMSSLTIMFVSDLVNRGISMVGGARKPVRLDCL